MYGATPYGTAPVHSLWAVGKAAYVALVAAVTAELLLTTRAWSRLLGWACGVSVAITFPFLLLVWRLELASGYQDESTVGVADELFRSPYFWTSVTAAVALTAGSSTCACSGNSEGSSGSRSSSSSKSRSGGRETGSTA
ncbi:hypothetical protein GPECTOR_99g823 [Gonium pectorale]|uniref:P-type ATPase C-terminal domain-containing protein n=1 Tax=Gonium pectorale TaxID=33097 RepID=A0A150G032_GONPE|nr:hypothetical protein GPECTOR_99g823 [Gonium pectorale]|eukprot:KXZ43188.1 hypothetical protein GPECTOR_99g823 [Gonium pectorale]